MHCHHCVCVCVWGGATVVLKVSPPTPMDSESKAKSPICLLIETDGCQSILSPLNTFGPEGVDMALALS